MTAFAGIDYDTRGVHVVILREDEPSEYICLLLLGVDAFERTREVRDRMPARLWWRDEGVVALGIEEPMARGKLSIQTTPKLKAIQGAILSCLPRDLLVNPMTANVWRTEVGLAGNASKDDISLFVHDDLRADPHWPQDACDAFCLALAVEKLTVPA